MTPTGNSFVATNKGLTNYPGSAFNARLRQEMLKYFNVENPSSFSIINPNGAEITPNDTIYSSLFSYLSPAAINLGVSSGGDVTDVTGKTPPYYSLLKDSTPFQGQPSLTNAPSTHAFYDQMGYSYVAAKIMSYNNTAILPLYDTTINQNSNTLLSQPADKIKYHTQQILLNRNCVAAMDNLHNTPGSNSPANFVGLFISDYLGEEIDVTDPLSNNAIKLDDIKDDLLNVSYKGGAEVSTFLSLVYGYSAQCGGLATRRKPSATTNSAEKAFDIYFFTEYKTPSRKENIYKKIANDMQKEGLPPGSFPSTLNKELSKLPNQIKSLMLENNGNARVRHKWLQHSGDPGRDPYYKACFAFNYRNLKKVEYLAGYEHGQPPKSAVISFDSGGGFTTTPGTPGSRPMIGNAIWKTLNKDVYAAAIGKKLFCRLKTYSKPEYGIVPMECLELPVLDEFFFLEPAPYDGNFPQAGDIPDLPIVDTSIIEEEPEDYSSSQFSIYPPGLDKMQQVEMGSVITNPDNNPDNPVAGPFGGLNLQGILGGPAGGPPGDSFSQSAKDAITAMGDQNGGPSGDEFSDKGGFNTMINMEKL